MYMLFSYQLCTYARVPMLLGLCFVDMYSKCARLYTMYVAQPLSVLEPDSMCPYERLYA